MNLSRRWLEAFLRRPLEAQDLARRLAMLGAPVDAGRTAAPGARRRSSSAGGVGRAPSQRRPAPALPGERRQRRAAARGLRRAQRRRGKEVPLRPGRQRRSPAASPSSGARSGARSPRACSAPPASWAWARSTTASSSSTPRRHPALRCSRRCPSPTSAWWWTSRPIAPTCWVTRAWPASWPGASARSFRLPEIPGAAADGLALAAPRGGAAGRRSGA